MRTKTLKQINAQTWDILCAITKTAAPVAEQVARMQKVKEIANRYRRNANKHIKATGIDDEMFGVLPVPASIYAKQPEV